MSQFWQSFADSFTPAYQQSLNSTRQAKDDEKRMRLQMALAEQQRQQESQRKLVADLEDNGLSSNLFMGQDGKFNEAAARARLDGVQRAKKLAFEADLDAQRMKARAQEDLYQRARSIGVDPARFGQPQPQQAAQSGFSFIPKQQAPGWFVGAPAQAPQKTLEQAVAEGEQAAKASSTRAAMRAKAQESLAQLLPMLPGGSESAGYNPDGTFDDATARALMDAQANNELTKTRNVSLMNARDDMKTMFPGLKDGTAEYDQRLNERKLYHTGGPEYRKAIAQIGDLYINDPVARRKEIDRIASLGGMERPRATPELEKTLAGFSSLQKGQQDLLDMIADHDARFPSAPISSMVGPFDNRTMRFNLAVNADASPAAKNAQRVLQFYQGLANQKLKDVSGAAVTDSEFERFLREAGDANNANFVNMIAGWHDATAQRFQNQLETASGYSFPDSIGNVRGKAPLEWLGYSGKRQQSAGGGAMGLPSQSEIDRELQRRAAGRGR